MSTLADDVAREAMELKLYHNFHGRGECWVSGDKQLVIPRWLWEPEKSWKQIGMVLDKMREDGFEYQLHSDMRYAVFTTIEDTYSDSGEDIKHAVCNVALAAKRAERGE